MDKILMNKNNVILVKECGLIKAFSYKSLMFTYDVNAGLLKVYTNVTNYSKTTKRHFNECFNIINNDYFIEKQVELEGVIAC